MGEKADLTVRTLQAELRGVMLPMGLELDRVTIQGEGLGIERDPIKFNLPTPGSLEVAITDLALQAFLEKKAPGGLRDFFVQLSDGQVHVHATGRFIIEVRAAAICNLRIQDGKQLFVDLEKVDVMGVGAKRLVQNQLDSVNPVFDVAELPVDATLTSVEIGGGMLIVKGTVAPKQEEESDGK